MTEMSSHTAHKRPSVKEWDFIYAPLHGFLVSMAQGWHIAPGPNKEPAFVGTHHGKYSILMMRDV